MDAVSATIALKALSPPSPTTVFDEASSLPWLSEWVSILVAASLRLVLLQEFSFRVLLPFCFVGNTSLGANHQFRRMWAHVYWSLGKPSQLALPPTAGRANDVLVTLFVMWGPCSSSISHTVLTPRSKSQTCEPSVPRTRSHYCGFQVSAVSDSGVLQICSHMVWQPVPYLI